jgi:hypothetical protein
MYMVIFISESRPEFIAEFGAVREGIRREYEVKKSTNAALD